MPAPARLVVGAAIVRDGQVLVAQRTHPPAVAGRWEFPGGKVETGESLEQAAVREVREELGCEVVVTRPLAGDQPVGYSLRLHVVLAEIVSGEPASGEHGALRWLGPEEVEDVDWLDPDRPFLPELREVLLDGRRLPGGNVGGAVLVGGTVRRATGPWTPAVHRLLTHLRAAGLPHVPAVLGFDARDREVLGYLPGRVVEVDHEQLSDAQLGELAAWAADLHAVVAGFEDGPWRFFGAERPTLVAHNDLTPYNVCWQGERLSGVFDWDLAGPSTPLLELAHLAWTGVPLVRALDARESARRLEVVAAAYGHGVTARSVLETVPVRVQLAVDGIREAVARGDEGMRNLLRVGEPERTERALVDFEARRGEIEALLAP